MTNINSSIERDALGERVLDAARRLVAECSPNVTYAVIEALLEQRLGDLVELVRVASPQDRPEAPDPGTEWTQAVRELLSRELGRPALSLRAAARALAVSARTLQRRLADEGTTWRAEIDAARRERAAQLLRQGTETHVAAAQVGYSGSRALRRALRRWDREQVDASGPQVDVSCPPRPYGRLA
jgi:AraC-like DNA-binding protein